VGVVGGVFRETVACKRRHRDGNTGRNAAAVHRCLVAIALLTLTVDVAGRVQLMRCAERVG
jgi:hypothetical protein